MKKIIDPPEDTWALLSARPRLESRELDEQVIDILRQVKQFGDQALIAYNKKFDRAQTEILTVPSEDIVSAAGKIDFNLKDAMRIATFNIRKFHEAQARPVLSVETTPGVICWRRSLPLGRVGIYVPGGTAPLFSTLLMLGLPAQLAGCKDIVVCSPPLPDGSLPPVILYAAELCGIQEIYAVGGAQAIAAMAYGTETIPKVDKIFGPGNQYVTRAKQLVNLDGTAIDLPAGPSEVLVIADESANPDFVAADLLSQAEHGEDSQVVLLATQEATLEAVLGALDNQTGNLPRGGIAAACLKNSLAIRLQSVEECIRFSNCYAPEHLILQVKDASGWIDRIENAGSVFIGPWSPESVGDYASGTNHTLPTQGFARAYSGVSLESFTKTITYQQLSPEGLRHLGPAVETMAEAESLVAHKMAVRIRLNALDKPNSSK